MPARWSHETKTKIKTIVAIKMMVWYQHSLPHLPQQQYHHHCDEAEDFKIKTMQERETSKNDKPKKHSNITTNPRSN